MLVELAELEDTEMHQEDPRDLQVAEAQGTQAVRKVDQLVVQAQQTQEAVEVVLQVTLETQPNNQ
jgi:CII-binding regulator of phage lambda lysogenization HflD